MQAAEEVEEVQEVNMLDSIIFENCPLSYQLCDSLIDLENISMSNDGTNELFSASIVGNPAEVQWKLKFEQLQPVTKPLKPSGEQTPSLDLKPLPAQLKYAFMGPHQNFPVVISSHLTDSQERKLLEVLTKHKKAIGWTLADIKGINPLVCTHKIYLEEDAKPAREMQRRLNPTMKEVVKTEVLKLLDVGYYQIEIAPEDQEKTPFTYLFGTFAFRRMSFGLCNAPATFQRCMLSIFSDLIENSLEVFMDDFSAFGSTFESCLTNLQAALARCEEKNLPLN
ncbi:uncharacterized protein LOC122301831 [Carya illinoinensis]|uniref:uncharacterized protein LOC122301831 n=1 Tax=Carya illinoinensis TaxID=32201 RepID=UPI001C722344|nr:uncharacterized protein LOC122301831 [Carya illinoinensis]